MGIYRSLVSMYICRYYNTQILPLYKTCNNITFLCINMLVEARLFIYSRAHFINYNSTTCIIEYGDVDVFIYPPHNITRGDQIA